MIDPQPLADIRFFELLDNEKAVLTIAGQGDLSGELSKQKTLFGRPR